MLTRERRRAGSALHPLSHDVAPSARALSQTAQASTPLAAWFAVQAGDRPAARAAVGAIGGRSQRIRTSPQRWARRCLPGDAAASLGDAAEARRLYDALSARHGRPVLASMV